MPQSLLKIILLASVADGEIQPSELAMMNQIKASHPTLKKIKDSEVQEASADIYNKLSAGMELKHIIEQLGESMSETQRNTAYALAKEVCAADYEMHPAENDYINELETQFSISDRVKDIVNESIKIRYAID